MRGQCTTKQQLCSTGIKQAQARQCAQNNSDFMSVHMHGQCAKRKKNSKNSDFTFEHMQGQCATKTSDFKLQHMHGQCATTSYVQQPIVQEHMHTSHNQLT